MDRASIVKTTIVVLRILLAVYCSRTKKSLAEHKELISHDNALRFQSGDEMVLFIMASWQFSMTQRSSRATSLP
jgi:hypothetical protein